MKKILAATAIGMNTIKKLVAGLAMACDVGRGVQGPFVVIKVVDGQTIWVDNGGMAARWPTSGLSPGCCSTST